MVAVQPKSPVTGDAPGKSADRDSSSRGPRPLVRAWLAALLVHALSISSGQLSDHAALIVNDIAWTAAASLAAISSFRAALSLRGCERTAWLLFAFACVAWTAGQVIWN